MISLVIGLVPEAFCRILNLQYYFFKVILELSWWNSNHLLFSCQSMMWNHWQHSCPHQLWHLLYLLYDLYTSKLLPIMTWYLLPIFIIFIKQMYTNGYLVDLESRGGWNELMAHKLIEETLNAQVAWRNPKCKNLLCKPSCVVKPTRTNLLFSFNFWHLGTFPSFPMQALGFLSKVYCMIKKDLECSR